MKLKSVGMQYRANSNEPSTKPQSSAAVEDVYEMIEGAALSAEDVVAWQREQNRSNFSRTMQRSSVSSI